MRSADLFMSEYRCTYRQFFHDFTPQQIESLTRKIMLRKNNAMRESIIAFHSEPQKVLDRLDDRDDELSETGPPAVNMEYTKEQIDHFNIRITKS